MKDLKFMLSISLATVMLSLSGCSQEDNPYDPDQVITENEKKLNLKSPSGVYIAEDIGSLKAEITQVIENSFHGESKDFEITSIQYTELPTGFFADIEYLTEDGISSNVIYISSETFERVKTRSETGTGGNGYFSCERRTDSEACKSSCKTYYDVNHKYFYCGCDEGSNEGCKLVAKP